jgi:peptidoglycan/xylan/chitin deacetylase (PgdA/CDA1 family)
LGKHRFNDAHGARNWARMQALLIAIKSLPPEQCDQLCDEITSRLPAPQHAVVAPLSQSEVRDLAQDPLVTIGAHSHGHEVLTKINLEMARKSITDSVERLTAWSGTAPEHFAYPAGYHDAPLENLVASMGFASAMSTVSGIWRKADSVYRIPRIAVGRYDQLDKFKVLALWG